MTAARGSFAGAGELMPPDAASSQRPLANEHRRMSGDWLQSDGLPVHTALSWARKFPKITLRPRCLRANGEQRPPKLLALKAISQADR